MTYLTYWLIMWCPLRCTNPIGYKYGAYYGALNLLVINMVPTMVNLNYHKCCTYYAGALSLLVYECCTYYGELFLLIISAVPDKAHLT